MLIYMATISTRSAQLPMRYQWLEVADRGKFGLTQAVRTVTALVDTRPGADEPVVRYDLGHGRCTNDAYALCPHRMAYARCSFYEPASEFAQVLQRQRGRFLRMQQELELTRG